MLGGERKGLLHNFSNEGYLTKGEAETLLGLIDEIKTDYPIVEIGVFAGTTTLLLAEYLLMNKRPNKIIGIDPCIWIGEDDVRNRYAQFSNIEFINGRSEDQKVIDGIPHISMLFIDGDHSAAAVDLDIINWIPKVKDSVAFHDYYSPVSDHSGIKIAAEKHGLAIEKGNDTIGILRIHAKV